ncbi:MAG: hypothetical protein ACD_54C01323G0001, partial [uncultured bacterium]
MIRLPIEDALPALRAALSARG